MAVTIDASNPYIGEYDAYATTAKNAYQKALLKIGQQRTGFQTGYGLGPDGKPLADQPFGQYQQMMGGLAAQAEGSDAMSRSRGLGGGLSAQAQQAAERLSQQTTYDFGQNYAAGLNSFSEAEGGAAEEYNSGLSAKMTEITQRAIQDRLFSAPDYGGIDYPGYGDGTPLPGTVPGGMLPWKPPVRKTKPKRRNRRRRR